MSLNSLSELTNGAIPYGTFTDFILGEGPVKAKLIAEVFLGYPIKDSTVQMLFDSNGKPLTNKDDQPIALPWRWPAGLAEKIIQNAGRSNAVTTADIADLPVPFWQPVDLILFTHDDYVIAAVRSNSTGNAVGKALTASAGFTLAGEDPYACADRELDEEMGVSLNDIFSYNIHIMPEVIKNRPLQRFNENVSPDSNKPNIRASCCPTIVKTVAAETKQTLDELMQIVMSNHESVGFVAVKAVNFQTIAQDPLASVTARFWPSAGLHDLVLNGQNLLTTISPNGTLTRLREALVSLRASPGTPQTRLDRSCRFKLLGPTDILVTGTDFMHGQSKEALIKTAEAAAVMNITPAVSSGNLASRPLGGLDR